MIKRFEIVDHGSGRPDAERIVFCDGAGGAMFRDETDLELSHWRPNRTPTEYRAATSTEICFRFVERPRAGDWTAAVNNHVDVDGILSVYVLTHRDHAQSNRRAIVEAAEMGDFWSWGGPPAQRVFQGVTRIMASGGSGRTVYEEAFERVPGLIDASDLEVAEIEASLAPLRQAVELIEQGRIARTLLDERLAHYVVPLDVAGEEDARAGYAPEFNEAISDKAVLWPQARARWDAQRVCLVSVERRGGWFHDLCFPGYLWADTQDRWTVPGMTYHDGMSSYEIDHPRLVEALQRLQREEPGPGQWGLGGTAMPYGETLQKRFPVVGRIANDRCEPTISRLKPEQVAEALAGVL